MTLPFSVAAPCAPPVPLDFITTDLLTQNSATYVFTNVPAGDPNPDRWLLVPLFWSQTRNIVAVVIGGVLATVTAVASNGVWNTAIAFAKVPLGATVTITVGLSAVATGFVVYGLYRTLKASLYDSGSSILPAPEATLNVPDRGVAIGIAFNNTLSGMVTWTGMAPDFGTLPYQGASAKFYRAVTQLFKATFSTPDTLAAGSFASFGTS